MTSHSTSLRRRFPRFVPVTLVLVFCLLGLTALPPARVRATPFARELDAAPSRRPDQVPEPPTPEVTAELVGRTAFSRTLRNPDGSFTTSFSQRPLHWRDRASGEWREFVNAVRPASGDEAQRGFAYANRANGFTVAFGKAPEVALGRTVVRVASDEVALEMSGLGLVPHTASAEGAQVMYTEARPGVDLRYTLDNERVKEDLILKTAPQTAAQATFAFALQLEGVSATRQADGALTFADASGATRFVMPRPFLLDSSAPEPQASDAVQLTLAQLGNGRVRLTLAADLAWLQDPARVYPVVLDPTIITASDGDATYADIRQPSPTTNFSTGLTFTVGKNSSGSRFDTLLQFGDVDALPRDSVVTQASLRLYATSGAALPLEGYRNTTAWTASSVTWNSAPSMSSTRQASWSSTVPGWNTVDVTGVARSWARGELTNYGLRLLSTGANGLTTVYRSPLTTTTSQRPQLDITYVQATRYGLTNQWTYTSQDYGGGNSSFVNVATGNLVFRHSGGAIGARGFEVDLTHTHNSQDAFGRQSSLVDPDPNTTQLQGGNYGSGWSFSQDVRLSELTGGNAVVFKDGSGNAERVYVKDADTSGTRDYLRPLHFGATLTKDISTPPADASKVYKLVADEGATTQFFDAAGKRTRIEDRTGNFLSFTYDASARLWKITDVANRVTTLAYNANGRLSTITDMVGRVSSYGYDPAKPEHLTTIKHAVGTADEVTTTLAWDNSGTIDTVTNPRGHTSSLDYVRMHDWNTAANVEGWAVDSGPATLSQSTEQAYANQGGEGSLKVNLTAISSSTSASIARTFATPQSFGSVALAFIFHVYMPAAAPELRATLIVGHSTSSESYSATLPAQAQGGWLTVRVEGVAVDRATPVSKLTLRFATASSPATYTGPLYVDRMHVRGVTGSTTDAKTAQTVLASYSYNWDGKATTVARPDQTGTLKNTVYTYGSVGQVKSVTDPLGNVTEQASDEFLRLTSVTLPGGSSSSYSYSYYPNSNQLQSWSNEAGETSRRGANTTTGDTRYSIDPLNEGRRTANPTEDYQATIYTRDTAGNVTSVATNWYGASTDLEASQSSFPTPLATTRAMTFTYTTGGLISRMTDPKGNSTDLTYQTGNTGYLTKLDAPKGTGETTRRITTITRNPDGSVQQVVDPKGQTTTYEYDNLGRLRKINYGVVGGVAAFSRSYTLDANGNMTAMTDTTGSTTWSYDENNRVTSEARTQNSVTKTAGYSYYANGLQSTLTTFANQTVSFGYDAALRLTSQTDPKDAGRTISYGYDTRSRRTSITYPSGVSQQQSYDTGNRVDLLWLQKSDGTKLQQFDYYYGFNASNVRQSDYDNGNVVKVTELDGSQVAYDYDALNRLTAATRTGTYPFSQSYEYDANNNRTKVTVGGVATSATYDTANQMISNGSTSYGYDRNGNLTASGSDSLSYDAANTWSSGTIGASSVALGYDGLGRRVSRTVGTARTDFWYDASGLTQESGAVARTYLRDPDGRLLSLTQSTTVYNYGRDRLGSSTGLVDGAGALVRSFAYDPWGKSIGTTGTLYNPFQFTGTYLDSATGYYQMGARYYQPNWGRFSQQDPLPRSMITINRYAYAGCNPTNYVDPSGLWYCSANGSIGVVGSVGGSINVGSQGISVQGSTGVSAVPAPRGSATVSCSTGDPGPSATFTGGIGVLGQVSIGGTSVGSESVGAGIGIGGPTFAIDFSTAPWYLVNW